jgi:hypothetical protein
VSGAGGDPGRATRHAVAALGVAALLALPAGAARAQTMLDQEVRLVEIHSLLMPLPALAPPGALAPWQASLSLEVIGIPEIDGTTGGKRQITASDRTSAFPRPRLALGLPLGGELSAFVGAAYIPPVAINRVTSHEGALEAGVAWRREALALGLRAHGLYATSTSPVTEIDTLDTLRSIVVGGDLAAAWTLGDGGHAVTPWLSVGLARVDGRFRVTSDGAILTSRTTDFTLSGGVRVQLLAQLDLAGEVVAWPGRMVHPALRLAWTPAFGQ